MQPAWRLRHKQAFQDEKDPGRQRYPEYASPREVLEGQEAPCVGQLCSLVHADAEIHPDSRSGDDSEREQPLEDARPPAAAGGSETLREIERNHHPYEAAA